MAGSGATVYKVLMRQMARTLGVAICLVLPMASVAAETETERLLRVERPRIDKIAALTAKEHSIVLFSIAEYIVGYAKDGQLQWISTTTGSPCPYAFPVLSHRGDKVLYQAAAEDHKCHLLLYDMASHSSRQVLEKESGAFFGTSWSWDDSQISVLDPRGIITLTIESGSQSLALPRSEVERDGYSLGPPTPWSYEGDTLIITLEKFIADAKQRDPRGTSGRTVFYLASVKDGHAHVFAEGTSPSVSPAGDEIAAFVDNKLVVMTADGRQQRVVSKAPRYPRYLPLFPGDLAGRIVWSPNADRLFFLNSVSDNGTDNIYLVDLRGGHGRLFLEKTTVRILGWR